MPFLSESEILNDIVCKIWVFCSHIYRNKLFGIQAFSVLENRNFSRGSDCFLH